MWSWCTCERPCSARSGYEENKQKKNPKRKIQFDISHRRNPPAMTHSEQQHQQFPIFLTSRGVFEQLHLLNWRNSFSETQTEMLQGFLAQEIKPEGDSFGAADTVKLVETQQVDSCQK